MRRLWVRRVDDEGVVVVDLGDRPIDVCIDGRRVWTFWTRRDTERILPVRGAGRLPWRRAPWPEPLRRHLNGRGRVTVREPRDGTTLFDAEVSLGDGERALRVQNRNGVDLSVDKSGRLVPTFAGRSQEDIAALMTAVDRVLEALREVGLEPFVAYGTLLGAVREGAVLGHDSDADLAYVSEHSTPVDVARESFRVQRELAARGWRIVRYSGAAFKILVQEGEVTRGLDVFGGFLDEGRLHLMGEVGTAFRHEWLYPLGSAELEGHRVPVPARPERLLEAMYGPSWRVPDPAFQFTTPRRVSRAFNDWFRGFQPGIRFWDRQAFITRGHPVRTNPTPLARRAAEEAQRLGAEVIDVGAARGPDALWVARQGLPVRAYDYVPRAMDDALAMARAESLDFEVRALNLAELRSVLVEGARLAHTPRPRVIMARHVLDATSPVGRESLARLCSMALRSGGMLLAQIFMPVVDDPPEWMVGEVDVEAVVAMLRSAGAREVETTTREKKGRVIVNFVGVW